MGEVKVWVREWMCEVISGIVNIMCMRCRNVESACSVLCGI